ncbi:hypothetical protein [Streptomyces scabiei]|uniref:hypothetical protein n=1 Tax=Streptomyces scabiei TaxID=1930 RepID=UPI00390825AF
MRGEAEDTARAPGGAARTAEDTARASGEAAARTAEEVAPTADGGQGDGRENDAARRRRRAQFLRELTEARELRDRVQPRRAKAARLRHAMRMRTFRW